MNVLNSIDGVYGSSAGSINGSYFISGQAPYGTTIYYEDINNKSFINKFNKTVGVKYLVSPKMRMVFGCIVIFLALLPTQVLCDEVDSTETPNFLEVSIVSNWDDYTVMALNIGYEKNREILNASLSTGFQFIVGNLWYKNDSDFLWGGGGLLRYRKSVLILQIQLRTLVDESRDSRHARFEFVPGFRIIIANHLMLGIDVTKTFWTLEKYDNILIGPTVTYVK